MLFKKHHNIHRDYCLNKRKDQCVIGMAGTFLRLLVIFLGFSHLVCLHAVPVTRTRSLWHGTQGHQVLENSHLVITEKVKEMKLVNGRIMDVELHDYPGSGANNRHTPKPQQPGRGCIDC